MEKEIKYLFCLGIGCLINGFIIAGAQAFIFLYVWGTNKSYLKLGLTGIGYASGLFMIVNGIVNLVTAYRIRQNALFQYEQPQTKDLIMKSGRAVVALNALALVLCIPTMVISGVLAHRTDMQGNFWTDVDTQGTIHESTDNLVFSGAIAMGVFSGIGAILSTCALWIGFKIVQHAKHSLQSQQTNSGRVPYNHLYSQ